MIEKNRNAVKVPVEKVEIVLKAIFSTIVPDENTNRFISCEKMISILRYLCKSSEECYLIVRRNRNILKYKNGKVYNDAPVTGSDERRSAREAG